MADITFKVTGLDEISQYFRDKAPNALTQGISDALGDLRDQIETETTTLCPVDTGALRASIDIEQKTDFAIIARAGMDYASFVDEGTRFMSAEPFFTDPITQAVDQFQANLEQIIISSLESAK